MAVSPLLQIPLLSTNQSAKEQTINTAISALEKSWNAEVSIDLTSGDGSILELDLLRFMVFSTVGVGVPRTVTVPEATRMWILNNNDGTETTTVDSGTHQVTAPAGESILIMQSGTVLIMLAQSATSGANLLTDLTDVPNAYGTVNQVLAVNAGGTGVEWIDPSTFTITSILQIPDVPNAFGTEGQVLKVNPAGDALIWGNSGDTVIGLSDTPSDYTGSANKILAVNETADGVVFSNPSISALADIDITTTPPVEADFLSWDSSLQKFIPRQSIVDAPSNGSTYARKDNNWLDITSSLNTKLSILNKTANYTLILSDAEKYIRMNDPSSLTLTVPPNSAVEFPVGTSLTVRNAGSGTTTFIEGAGVTLNSSDTLTISVQHGTVTLVKVDTNEWDIVGSLEAV